MALSSSVRRRRMAVIDGALALAIGVAGLALAGCGRPNEVSIDPGDSGDYRVALDPATFVATIDNPWLPFRPGSHWVYEDRSDTGRTRIEVNVTAEAREIMRIQATVVRVTETFDGRVVEDTFDWYAQDRDGNVWYMGEATTASPTGKQASSAGSWEAGVDGAFPGIVMKADPQVGDAYRQEYYPGRAEDMAEIVRVGESLSVPLRSFEGVLVTKEWTPLEPGVVEEKFYARGVGLVREAHVQGGSAGVDLVSFEPGH